MNRLKCDSCGYVGQQYPAGIYFMDMFFYNKCISCSNEALACSGCSSKNIECSSCKRDRTIKEVIDETEM